jgi:hypothetical protein
MEHKREGMRLILTCTGVLVVGVTSVARGRERAREREFGLEVRRLSLPPPCLSCSSCLCSSSPCVRASCLRKALDVPFYRYKEMAQLYNGMSYVLTWLVDKCFEPCTCANVAIGEVP